MTVYLQDTDLTLHHGDCLEVLRTLPDRSVHMCATSPPFYGLRDYGTGEWEGGDPDCDHVKATRQAQRDASGGFGGRDLGTRGEQGYAAASGVDIPFGSECGKCGARRVDQQIGLEETPDQWVERLVAVFREVRRVLRDDGTLWVEIGDSYMANQSGANLGGIAPSAWTGRSNTPKMPHPTKPKDLLGQPWLLAFALRADGWFLRSEIIWARPNAMPESVTDRPTKSHSTIFLLSKNPRYYFDADAIREPHQHDGRKVTHVEKGDGSIQHRNGERWPGTGANARSVWWQATEPTPFAHFATWPRKLVARMILAGTSERGCCPECGAPWVRDVERDAPPENATPGYTPAFQTRRFASATPGHITGSRTLGWSPPCVCYDKTPDSDGPLYGTAHAAPCTVLDPFAGSGTTLLVARQHGRHSIGIELNQSYCELVRDRTSQQSLLADAQ